jgi:hypothetical protein
MAAQVELGTAGTTDATDGISEELSEAGTTITKTLKARLSERATFRASLKQMLGEPCPDDPDLVLRTVTINSQRGMLYATLKYAAPNARTSSDSAPPIGSVSYRSASTTLSIPIEQHPDYDEAWAESKKGVESYMVPSVVFTRTRTLDPGNFSLTQSQLIGGVGTLADPPDVSGIGTANRWLQVGKDVQIDPDRVVVSDSYHYAGNGWDTDIY